MPTGRLGQRIRAAVDRLRRLRRDRRGNTLVIVGVALLPLTAMIGSGLDMSRAYMAQARLQQACDAASLAGRRVMTGDTIDDTVRGEVNKFLNFNFPQRKFGTAAFTPVISRPTAGTVRVSANTTLPTAVMQLFGFTTLPINVTCDAAQTFVNADIILVLDTTGSMDQSLNGERKIVSLRNAVIALYRVLQPTQALLEANGYRLRIGIVPYSQTVNVGKLLRGVNQNFIRDPAPYTSAFAACTDGQCSDIRVWMGSHTVDHDNNWFQNTWGGCIVERQTVATVATVPSATELPNMFDLDIDMVPDARPETQWTPYDPNANMSGIATGLGTACPSEARRLRAWNETDLQNYVNALVPVGATYHDIGMIWGARLISDAGVFADSPANFNGMRTNKFVIFLSDGQMEPNQLTYAAYGTEWAENRITGNAFLSPKLLSNQGGYGTLAARHTARFDEMCRRVRARASVYVIAFSTGLSDSMRDCATGGLNQASTAANSAQLIAQFEQIGREITELRVAQ